jgi:hypothetical protein
MSCTLCLSYPIVQGTFCAQCICSRNSCTRPKANGKKRCQPCIKSQEVSNTKQKLKKNEQRRIVKEEKKPAPYAMTSVTIVQHDPALIIAFSKVATVNHQLLVDATIKLLAHKKTVTPWRFIFNSKYNVHRDHVMTMSSAFRYHDVLLTTFPLTFAGMKIEQERFKNSDDLFLTFQRRDKFTTQLLSMDMFKARDNYRQVMEDIRCLKPVATISISGMTCLSDDVETQMERDPSLAISGLESTSTYQDLMNAISCVQVKIDALLGMAKILQQKQQELSSNHVVFERFEQLDNCDPGKCVCAVCSTVKKLQLPSSFPEIKPATMAEFEKKLPVVFGLKFTCDARISLIQLRTPVYVDGFEIGTSLVQRNVSIDAGALTEEFLNNLRGANVGETMDMSNGVDPLLITEMADWLRFITVSDNRKVYVFQDTQQRHVDIMFKFGGSFAENETHVRLVYSSSLLKNVPAYVYSEIMKKMYVLPLKHLDSDEHITLSREVETTSLSKSQVYIESIVLKQVQKQRLNNDTTITMTKTKTEKTRMEFSVKISQVVKRGLELSEFWCAVKEKMKSAKRTKRQLQEISSHNEEKMHTLKYELREKDMDIQNQRIARISGDVECAIQEIAELRSIINNFVEKQVMPMMVRDKLTHSPIGAIQLSAMISKPIVNDNKLILRNNENIQLPFKWQEQLGAGIMKKLYTGLFEDLNSADMMSMKTGQYSAEMLEEKKRQTYNDTRVQIEKLQQEKRELLSRVSCEEKNAEDDFARDYLQFCKKYNIKHKKRK